MEHDIDLIITGENRVDLRSALSTISEAYGIKRIRVNSGGGLNGALQRAKLVNELSVLVASLLVGRSSPTSLIVDPNSELDMDATRLKLLAAERFPGYHVWLH